jgi:hypothetical protein
MKGFQLLRVRSRRSASVFSCVLVVLLLVGLLCMQTTQTLLIIRRSDMERTKLHQAREAIELARSIDWNNVQSHSEQPKAPQSRQFTVQIPQSASEGWPATALTAVIEGYHVGNTNSPIQRILVSFPSENPGKVTASWEPHYE